MTKRNRVFGTDGIRGRVGGDGLIQPDLAMRVGYAAGQMLRESQHQPSVLIGKDTRVSNYMIEAALQAGFCAAGVNVHLLGPMPTPAVAYLTSTLRASAGLMISASHNAYEDNGIKIFDQQGSKLDDATEEKIESYINNAPISLTGNDIGRARRIKGAPARYIEFCKSKLAFNQSLRGIKCVIDCANGATYHVAPDVFSELGAEVSVIHNEPNGININDACGSTEPNDLIKHVLQEGADIGIAFDGDGDRVILVDHQGRVCDGDHMLYLVSRYLQEKNSLTGGVVGTVMSNQALAIAMDSLGIPFMRSDVGDRHVMKLLRNQQWELGGEPSGHVIHLAKSPSGDGIVTAVMVLGIMQETGLDLATLLQSFEKFPQILINVPVAHRMDLESKDITNLVRDAEADIGSTGRVLIRHSGTEPLVRVMVEGESLSDVETAAKALAEHIQALAA